MNVFITGSTGYIARHVIPELADRGHAVRGLVRRGSEAKLARGAIAVTGDALDATTFSPDGSDTLIHLVGVAHPSPSKAAEFRRIDLASIRATVAAIRGTSIRHVVYLSVAQPAPVMKEYVAVRAEGERLLRESGVPATFIRPWYVLGPGHWWPYAVLPLYWIWGAFPKHRDTARRLYPVTIRDVVRAIVSAVDAPPDGVRIIEAPEMISARRAAASPAHPAATTAPAHPPR